MVRSNEVRSNAVRSNEVRSNDVRSNDVRSNEVRYPISKYPYYRTQMGSPWLATGSYFGKMMSRAPGRFLNTSGASGMP